MQRFQSDAVSLTGRDLGEADRIIEFLTRDHGKLSAVARGARKSRKRFGGRLDKFVCVEIHAVERQPGALARLEEVRVREYFPGLSSDLERLTMAEVFLELSGRFAVPGEEGKGIFDQLLSAWRVMQTGEMTQAGFFLGILVTLQNQGVLAPLNVCAVCHGALAAPSFIPEAGGLVCSRCRKGRQTLSDPLTARLSALPNEVPAEDWSRFAGEGTAAELKGIAKSSLEWFGGGALRSLKVWEEFS